MDHTRNTLEGQKVQGRRDSRNVEHFVHGQDDIWRRRAIGVLGACQVRCGRGEGGGRIISGFDSPRSVGD